MAVITSVQTLIDAENSGQFSWATFRKVPSQTGTNGVMFDLSGSAGTPVPQYYAATPMVSQALRYSTDGGLNVGGPVAPKTKYLRSTTLLSSSATGLPLNAYLLDYLLFYPFVDESSVDEQFVTNSVSLPRYQDGLGVQIMCVSQASRNGGRQFRIKYTNSDGVSGRLTPYVVTNTATGNGSVVTTQLQSALNAGPFLPLQEGDKGVRYVESVQMLTDDVGLFAIVLVKPIANQLLVEQTAAVEVDYFKDKSLLPVIQDDAYLNWVAHPSASLAGVTIMGEIKTVFY